MMETLENTVETDAKETSRLAGTVNWGTATVVGVFAGLLYGGSKEAAASVSKDAEVMLKLGSTPDKREQYRLMRDAMEKRFIRVTRGSIIGGVRLGMFTATFFGIQNLLAEKRGMHDIFNVVGAGSATAATFGLIMPGSLSWRARNMLMGSVLGAAFGFPLGWAHLKLVEKANEGSTELEAGQGRKSGVSAAIESLEGRDFILSRSPLESRWQCIPMAFSLSQTLDGVLGALLACMASRECNPIKLSNKISLSSNLMEMSLI